MNPELPTPEPYSPEPKKRGFKAKLESFKHWASNNKKKLYFYSALGVVVIVGAGLWAMMYFWNGPSALNFPKTEPVKEEQKFYSPLTGVEVPDEVTSKKIVTAIMLENSPDARPQSGLKDAGICFEAIAEGGITRFACLYQETRPGLIGPVRSLRPYYLDWVAGFDPAIAHIGGSASALNEVRNGSYKDIDQFFNPGAYWRAADRYAPHNVYTNFDRLDALNANKGFTTSNFVAFTRKPLIKTPKDVANNDAVNAKLPNANSIDVQMSGGTYNSTYQYDPTKKEYARSQGGGPHMDREGGLITPEVVIVMKVNMFRGFEDGYREQITTLGSGPAYIFQEGRVIEGDWHKSEKRGLLKFTDKNGNVIALTRGQTWIAAIPNEKSVTWQ